jgi:hypothetical protein
MELISELMIAAADIAVALVVAVSLPSSQAKKIWAFCQFGVIHHPNWLPTFLVSSKLDRRVMSDDRGPAACMEMDIHALRLLYRVVNEAHEN